jgi:hypothetical protein
MFDELRYNKLHFGFLYRAVVGSKDSKERTTFNFNVNSA